MPWYASKSAKSGKLGRLKLTSNRKEVSPLLGSALLSLALFLLAPGASAKWKYFRAGNAADSTATPRAGFALMGGGEQDPALKNLCERANGGDFLILRANTEDDYAQKVNEEMRALCPLNSAATIVFSEREDSDNPKLLERIGQAEAIFIAGGDQANYVRFWQDTPVEEALNRHIAAGKPLGGSSAGLAVLGEFSFSSMIDTIHSPAALADPYDNKVTISRDFLRIPLLTGIITDTHFAKRDRMGRLLVFLARILQDGWAKQVRAIAIEEGAAVLLEPDGQAKVIGSGPAYFLEAKNLPSVCQRQTALGFSGIKVHRSPTGTSFNVKDWKGTGGDDYQLSVVNGVVNAAGSNHGIY
ncbi:MAG TPA: cyanophycinase [Candidatus Acidoferrum sp.]|nr:cyanophycinase [Candidatus Acidoferrum sp.]